MKTAIKRIPFLQEFMSATTNHMMLFKNQDTLASLGHQGSSIKRADARADEDGVQIFGHLGRLEIVFKHVGGQHGRRLDTPVSFGSRPSIGDPLGSGEQEPEY